MRVKTIALALVFCAVLWGAELADAKLAGADQAEQKPSVVHFIVVTNGIEGVNYDREVPALEKEFCRLAGGYTALGETHGGFLGETSIIRDSVFSYVVSSRRNVAPQIRAYVLEHFRKEPFILFWTAEQLELE